MRVPGALKSALVIAPALFVALGCGAKSGLEVPEVENDADAGLPCFEVPIDGGPIDVELDTRPRFARADIVFLIDVTASMRDEINEVQDRLRDKIAPAIEAQIPDTQIGVATFADFPVEPYGAPGDSAFSLLTPITDNLSEVQAALDAIEIQNGIDDPESQVEALYQTATGEGLGGFVLQSFGCPMGGSGYPCFRADSIPVVLLFTDQVFHNGPGGSAPYSSILSPSPHSYEEARDALLAKGIRVIGLESGGGVATEDLRTVARDTGAVDDGNNPLVFDIGRKGQRLGNGVITAMQTFADSAVFDVRFVVRDGDPGDGTDATTFIESVTPVRAEPMDGIEGIDTENGVFLGVEAGTNLIYELRVSSGATVPGPEPKRFVVAIDFIDENGVPLGTRTIELVIPAADGEGCPD